jgi:seryl-tRNA synthetase
VREACRIRGSDVDVDELVRLERERRVIASDLDELRSEVKKNARAFSELRTAPEAELAVVREVAERLKKEERTISGRLREVTESRDALWEWLPNFLDPRVPVGDESANEVLRVVGEKPDFGFQPLGHDVLGERLDLIDVRRAVQAAGSQFYMLKNDAVLLRGAIGAMLRDRLGPQGFELVSPPVLARPRTLFATGELPFFRSDYYRLADSDLTLIGTSEQALLGVHVDEMLDRLPIAYLGDSMCFRIEAGSAGRDTAGVLRVHQFYKLEQLVYCDPDSSEEWHLRCLENEEWLLGQLEIPYRAVLLATGDLQPQALIKYDTEGWFPSLGEYRELTSNSNLGDFQTRRGNIRFKDGKRRVFPHTISATGFSDRLIFALLENHQQEDGTVTVPPALEPYLGVSRIRPRDRGQG